MASASENTAFVKDVLPQYLLDDAIEWIKDNLKPDDVFEEATLIEWAEEQDPDEVYEPETLKKWAESEGVDSVFEEDELLKWARTQTPTDIFTEEELKECLGLE